MIGLPLHSSQTHCLGRSHEALNSTVFLGKCPPFSSLNRSPPDLRIVQDTDRWFESHPQDLLNLPESQFPFRKIIGSTSGEDQMREGKGSTCLTRRKCAKGISFRSASYPAALIFSAWFPALYRRPWQRLPAWPNHTGSSEPSFD